MASFDLDTFLKVQGNTGTGIFDSIGMAYGVPSCLLNMARGAFSLLPTPVLTDVGDKIAEGKAAANNLTKSIFKKLALDSGIFEFDTETGTIKFFGKGWNGIDNDTKASLNNLNGLLAGLEQAAAFGTQLYQNIQSIGDQIDSMLDCLGKLSTVKSFQGGNSADQRALLSDEDASDLFNSMYAGDVAKLQNTTDFIDSCNPQLDLINDILDDRANDPNLEPCFLDSAELDPFLDDTTFDRCPAVDPGLPQEDVFRLTYGPPLTNTGHYVLTSDGLYYDSQTGGLDPVYLAISGIVPVGDVWTYDYDPNLGGKGRAISIDSLNKFTDNIFDLAIIDDSVGLQEYYKEDHFLSVLVQQRDKHVSDLSGTLQEYITVYGTDSSITKNQRQSVISDIALHNSKINRRKKQIEVSVKAPQIYGDTNTPAFAPGDVPINDFGYLEDYNLVVDLEKQKALIFEQAEVGGIVLPLQPQFVQSVARPESTAVDHLYVPTMGKGSILYSPSSTQSATVLSLTDQIENGELFAIYNFLETKIELPSSVNFPTTNCATINNYNNGQLVSPSKEAIFFSGLGIPYLNGIVKNKSTDPVAASALGSYFRLPDTPEFRDLTYSPSGFTMECWVHVPNIMDGRVGWLSSTASSLTKALISSDNVGAASSASSLNYLGDPTDLDYLVNDRGGSFVRGMVCGFTRDRRITKAGYALGLSGYSNNNFDNDPASSLSFFVAPTQARDGSSASFINNDECQDSPSFYSMKVDLSSSNFGNVSSNFVLVDLVVDPVKDTIKFYADGALAATSSLSLVFGIQENGTINLPSFKKENSFEYSPSTVDGPTTLTTGPLLNPFYTPWIVGGGYTDGMYKDGNFLGSDRSGITSGLRGHVGSLKFYSRPLNNAQVLKNYKAQSGFFKFIEM